MNNLKAFLANAKNNMSKSGWVLIALAVFLLLLGIYLLCRFGGDRAVEYEATEDHFKYGSLGGERNLGFPYWIWKALPKVCPHLLPGEGYQSLGMFYEEGKDLPVGVSKRRYRGLDMVFLNCAVCHTSTVQITEEEEPLLIFGMPANTFDLMTFQKFFFDCAADARFSPDTIIPIIESLGGDLDVIDKQIVYPLAVYIMRDQVFGLAKRFSVINEQPPWGPGRVDTFSAAKALFNFPFDRAPEKEKLGTTDFPSIWLQEPRQGMQLHWDGNNTKVEERNRSAAFGAGANPRFLDREAMKRIEDWLLTLPPPVFPYDINKTLATQGETLYQKYCADCHGKNGRDFSGKYVGTVVPINEIGTDRWRLDSYTWELAVNQGQLYAGNEDERFQNFRKTNGYANSPLDGLWLRAPYLHNGSVPTLYALLQPAAQRPAVFCRGNDLYDPVNVGFAWQVDDNDSCGEYFKFDTSVRGNGNAGHDYGTDLSENEKLAIIEFLKTF